MSPSAMGAAITGGHDSVLACVKRESAGCPADGPAEVLRPLADRQPPPRRIKSMHGPRTRPPYCRAGHMRYGREGFRAFEPWPEERRKINVDIEGCVLTIKVDGKKSACGESQRRGRM